LIEALEESPVSQLELKVIVLHETVISEPPAPALFRTNHPNDDEQVTYHVLITPDGRRVRRIPDRKRNFCSGMSAFGDVVIRDQPGSVGSLNNIALYCSLPALSDHPGSIRSLLSPAAELCWLDQYDSWQA